MLRKKSESARGTTSSNSLPAPPAFSNDSLRSTGKIEKLKCKLAENQEKVQKLEEELNQTRKKLKSANVSIAMSSKRRASKTSTTKDSESRNLRRHAAEIHAHLQDLAGKDEDYIARILSNLSKRCTSNEKFTTIATDEYNAMREQSAVMMRIRSTVNYLLSNKNKNVSHCRTALQVLFAAAAPHENERLRAETARVMGVRKNSDFVKNGVERKKTFLAVARKTLSTSCSDISVGDRVTTTSGNGVVKKITDKNVVIRIDLGRGRTCNVTFPIPSEDDDTQSRKFGRIRRLIPPLWNTRAARSDVVSPDTVKKVCTFTRHLTIVMITTHVTKSYSLQIQEFIKLHCTRSSCRRDMVRRVLTTKAVESKAGLLLNDSLNNIWKKFQKKHPNVASWATFLSHRPWNLRRAYRSVCMCAKCLKFTSLAQAFSTQACVLLENIAKNLEDRLDRTSRDEDILSEVQVLLDYAKTLKKSRRQFCVKDCCDGQFLCMKPTKCVSSECSDCGHLQKSWTRLRRLIIATKDEDIAAEDASSSSADDENSEESKTERIRSNLGGRPFRTGTKRVQFISSTSQISSSFHLKASVSKIWNAKVKFDRVEKLQLDGDDKPRDTTVTKSSSLVDFVDLFMSEIRGYKEHRYLVERMKIAYAQMMESMRPGQRVLLVDFAENYTILETYEIQSNYWRRIQVSLHIGIEKRLDETEWSHGNIKVGDEVTILSSSVVCVVSCVVKSDGEMVYKLKGRGEYLYSRTHLGLRKWISVAHISISDDKKHDAAHVGAYLLDVIETMKKDGHAFTSLHVHTDNAPQHYKHSKTMHLFSHIIAEDDTISSGTWSFGCPGHGKGPWDGIGAFIKCLLRSDTDSKKVNPKSAYDVFLYLIRVANEGQLKDGSANISRYVILFSVYVYLLTTFAFYSDTYFMIFVNTRRKLIVQRSRTSTNPSLENFRISSFL